MIREPNAQAAIDLAQEFDRRGLGIAAKDGSVLQLLHTSATVDYVQPVSQMDFDPSAASICADTMVAPIGSNRSCHDEELDAQVLEIAAAARQHFSFARNTVAPLVKELYARLEAALKAIPETSTYNPEVIRVDLPAPMQSNVFEEMVAEYANVRYAPVTVPLALPEMAEGDLLEMLNTGSKIIDGDIAAWIQTVGASNVSEIYKLVFTRSMNITANRTCDQLINDRNSGVDAACVLFLLAKKLLDKVPEGVEMSLVEYRRAVGEVLAQAGLRLYHAYEERARQVKSGQMILTYSKDAVRVVAAVYDKWLAATTTPAALFGNLLSDNPSLYAASIDEKSGEYVRLWERQNQLLTMRQQNNRYSQIVELLRFKSEQLVADHLTDCFGQVVPEALSMNSPLVLEALDKINSYIDTLRLDDMKQLWDVCLEIVAGCIFHYTDSKKILKTIQTACEANPGMTPEEGALMSAIDYVVDYVADQLYVYEI